MLSKSMIILQLLPPKKHFYILSPELLIQFFQINHFDFFNCGAIKYGNIKTMLIIIPEYNAHITYFVFILHNRPPFFQIFFRLINAKNGDMILEACFIIRDLQRPINQSDSCCLKNYNGSFYNLSFLASSPQCRSRFFVPFNPCISEFLLLFVQLCFGNVRTIANCLLNSRAQYLVRLVFEEDLVKGIYVFWLLRFWRNERDFRMIYSALLFTGFLGLTRTYASHQFFMLNYEQFRIVFSQYFYQFITNLFQEIGGYQMQKLLIRPLALASKFNQNSSIIPFAVYPMLSNLSKRFCSSQTQPQNPSSEIPQIAPYKSLKEKRGFQYKFGRFMLQHLWPPSHPDRRIRGYMYKAYSLLSISKLCFMAMPLCLKYGTNAMSKTANIMHAPWYFLGYGALNILNVIVEGQKAKVISKITLDTWRQVSVQTFNHLLELDSEFHSGPQQKQSLLSMYRFAHHYLEKDARQLLLYLLPITIDFMLTTTYLHLKCGFKFLISFLTTAGIFTTFTFRQSSSRQAQLKHSKVFDHQGHFIVSEALYNYSNVKLFDAEQFEKNQFDLVLRNYIENKEKDISSLWDMTLWQKLIFVFGMTFNLFFAAVQVKQGKLNLGDIASIQTFMFQLMAPVTQLGNIVREVHETMYEIQELFSILEQEPKIKNPLNAKEFVYKQGELELQNVDFEYLKDQPIIKNINLKIQGECFVTIVGQIGSGKTTLIKLLLRFFDPTKGKVLIDGQDLKELNIESFRKYISTVSQQTYIFNDTIMYNLQYANMKKTREEIIEVCKQLKLHDYIMTLPQQYETKIGDQGNQFSGGERQRLAIARCILKDTPILLLDEATSNLDSNHEDNVAGILNNIKKNRTIVLVTHRLRLGSQADRVIFLKKNGSIVEGNHQQLVEADEEYRYMCRQLSQTNECILCEEKVQKILSTKDIILE